MTVEHWVVIILAMSAGMASSYAGVARCQNRELRRQVVELVERLAEYQTNFKGLS